MLREEQYTGFKGGFEEVFLRTEVLISQSSSQKNLNLVQPFINSCLYLG